MVYIAEKLILETTIHNAVIFFGKAEGGVVPVLHWVPKFGKSMDDVRDDVAALMEDHREDEPEEEEDEDDVVRYKTLDDIPAESYFRNIIDDLMEAKIINGSAEEDGVTIIDLSHDMVRMLIFEYRAGVYDDAIERAGRDPDAYKPKDLR